MDYETARPLISTGDLISVRVAHGLIGGITQVVTRSPYTHSGVAIWIAGSLYMAELNGGRNHLVPMSQLAQHSDFDVHHQPDGLVDVESAIHFWLRTVVGYGFIAFIAIGLLDLFKSRAFIHWRRILVCSGYVVAIWEKAGWPEHTRVLSPRALASLCILKLEVRP